MMIQKHKPQILLLDINLPDGTAFDLLQRYENKDFRIVFISAHSEYTLEALRFSFIDFVLKPFDANDLILAVDDAIAELDKKNYNLKIEALVDNINSDAGVKKLVIQGDGDFRVSSTKEIVWADSVFNGTMFYFSDGMDLFSPTPLRRYESLLRPHGFMRCHPKILINMTFVRFVDEDTNKLYMGSGLYLDFKPKKTELLKNMMRQYSVSKISKLHA